MLLWSIQVVLFSFIFIFLIHHLFSFFKNTLTTPKVKDLVNIHTEKYNAIYDVIHQVKHKDPYTSNKETIDVSSLLPTPNSFINPNSSIEKTNTNMKDELKNFLKKQMKSENHNDSDYQSSTSIDFLDSVK